MFGWLVVIAAVSAGAQTHVPQRESECWGIDKTSVMVGGCVTITLDERCSTMRNLRLHIDDREATRLLGGSGVTIQYTSGRSGKLNTFVLVSHNFVNSNAFEPLPGDARRMRMVPVFDHSGVVRLTLESNDEPLGSKLLTVLPLSGDAKRAMALLYPEVGPNRIRDPDGIEWVSLLIHGKFDVQGPIDARVSRRIDEELAIIRQHPDWGEIFEMLVARMRASLYRREVIVSEEGRPAMLRDMAELPPVPSIVTGCLDMKPVSPFALGIQDTIRGMMADIKRLKR